MKGVVSLTKLTSRNLLIICTLFASLLFAASCKKTEFTPVNTASDAGEINIAGTKIPAGTNVVLILGDDWGYELITANGGQSYSTPNIDKLAQDGMRFTQCHGSPLCSPARFTLLTGKYNFRNYTDWGVMNPNEKTLGTLFQSAGYKTCATGKWQLDGGDASIKSLGFDKYCLWNAYEIYTHGSQGSSYKNPTIYQDGAYLPSSETNGKYGEDFYSKYVTDFIDSNKNNNFFVYYAPPSVHTPFGPTPDDPEFATWDPKARISDPKFFPSMVSYVDKKVGEIVAKVKSLGLSDKTMIIFTGDNGTPTEIYSMFNGELVQGGKSSTTTWGTHVPMFIAGAGIPKGTVNNNLVSFTDFMMTFQEMTGADVSTYDTLDGISFYKQLYQQPYTPRPWIYDYYHPLTNSGNTSLRMWVQDSSYKLYGLTDKFFNITADPYEKSKIKKGAMTPQEKQIYKNFQKVLAQYPEYPAP